jgi:type VI secretion system secreted protein Hcp
MLVLIFAALGAVPTAEAAVDYVFEIDGILGDSQTQPNSIEVLAFSWGASRSGPNKKDLHLQELNAVKNVDRTSPPLFGRLAQGARIPSMELLGRKPGDRPLIYLRYCFQDVQVASISQGDSRDSETPTETVSFAYGAASQQYTIQKADGSAGDSVFAGWNATTGQLIAGYPSPCGGF